MDSKEETFQEIRDRRIKEFEAKIGSGVSIPCESVLPWYINKMDALKKRVEELELHIQQSETH
jgi:hypothetical protein